MKQREKMNLNYKILVGPNANAYPDNARFTQNTLLNLQNTHS